MPVTKNLLIQGELFEAEAVHRELSDLLTPERIKKIQEVTLRRTQKLTIVLERLYDLGNLSAIIRTAENLGLLDIHIIEAQNTKYSSRTTQGAHKWVNKYRWQESIPCLTELREQGFQLLATGLGNQAVPLHEVDFTRPSAIILGNEKDGVSPEVLSMADANCLIPTTGFSQSFNVSIAAAIILSHAFFKRDFNRGDLTQEERLQLEADYMLRTYKSPHKLYERLKAKPAL